MQGWCFSLSPREAALLEILSIHGHYCASVYTFLHISVSTWLWDLKYLILSMKWSVMVVRLAGHYQIFMSLYMCSCLYLAACEDWGPCSSIDWQMMGNKALFFYSIFLCCCWQLLVDCTMIRGFFPPITEHIYGNEIIAWAPTIWS